MHAGGLHSALAIKRQRKRRDEQKRAKERRYSTQSTESGLGESRSSCASPRNSIGSLDKKKGRRGGQKRRNMMVKPDKVVSGMLHIGVVFIVLGLFLLGSGLIPDDLDNFDSKNYKWFNELVISGAASVILGIFLVVLNSYITRKEEADLQEYVERQLTRSKSGHRLVRDVETGCLTTKRDASSSRLRSDDTASLVIDTDKCNGVLTPPVHHSPTLKSPPPLSASTPKSDLERILEEEFTDRSDQDPYLGIPQSRPFPPSKYYNNLEMCEN